MSTENTEKADQKAEELFEKFQKLFIAANADGWSEPAKDCAIICVDEIIAEQKSEAMEHRVQFWEQVKQSIQKL